MKPVEEIDMQYIKKIENIEFQPVFILGLHRSGTSILYKMINSTQCFNPVTAYHLIKYDQLLYNHINKKEETAKKELTCFIKKQGQVDRGIDRLKLNADFAEEYGFLLGKKTTQMYITPKNCSLFIELAKKIQFISEGNKPILLKNPYDLLNFLYIKKVFPNAKFIFMHRNPFKTLSSLNKAIKYLFKSRNPYTTLLFKNYKIIFDNPLLLYFARFIFSDFSPFGLIYLTMFSSRSIKYYMKNVQKLSKKDYVAIKYEQLCSSPEETMEKILKFLEIKKTNIDFIQFIKPRKTNLDKSVINLQNFIHFNMKEYFARFGYKKNTNNL